MATEVCLKFLPSKTVSSVVGRVQAYPQKCEPDDAK